MHLEKIKSLYPTVLLIIALALGSVYTAYLLATTGIMVGPIVIIGIIGILSLIFMLKEYKVGLYLMFIIGVFSAFINRVSGFPVQFGIVLDAIAGLTFVVMLVSDRFFEKRDWTPIKGGVLYVYIVVIVYQLLQVFNPNAVSFIGWLVGLRGLTSFLLFFVFFHLFLSFEEVKKFTALWIILATIVGLYGLWQEFVGLSDKELAWVYSTDQRVGLLLIWGHLRKFSLLSDPSAFGLFMAFSGLACFVLMLGPFQALYKIFFGLLSIMMFTSMSYSGTRTAFAMVVVGVAFYILITLKNRKTFLVMIGAGVVALGILFGPFYGGTANRIRSTFSKEDKSMGVRDRKRVALQEYIIAHPFGGGVNTTGQNGLKYSQGHKLSEGWDPDSGYLLTALELGWIGLILGLVFFGTVMIKGINNYFSTDDPVVKTMTLTYIVPFLALSAAHFTQDAMFTKPGHFVIVATYALMLTIPTYKKKTSNNHPSTL